MHSVSLTLTYYFTRASIQRVLIQYIIPETETIMGHSFKRREDDDNDADHDDGNLKRTTRTGQSAQRALHAIAFTAAVVGMMMAATTAVPGNNMIFQEAMAQTTTAPTVAITSPANNAQVTAGTVTFRGSASSSAGVAKVELAMDGNAASYRLATPASPGNWGTWSINYSVPAGSHYFVARVTDNAGRQQWHSISLKAVTGTTTTTTPPPSTTIPSTKQLTTGNSVFDRYDSIIAASAQKYGFPDPMILKSQISQESDFKSWVVSSDIPCGIPSGWTAGESHSYGLMQITPACNPPAYALLPNGHPNLTQDTSSSYWPTSVYNPSYNVDFAAKAMSTVYKYEKSKYPGCTESQYLKMSLGAYNSGYGSIYGCGSWNDRANTYINYVLSKYQYMAGLGGIPYPF
jgi:hypothetical protein